MENSKDYPQIITDIEKISPETAQVLRDIVDVDDVVREIANNLVLNKQFKLISQETIDKANNVTSYEFDDGKIKRSQKIIMSGDKIRLNTLSQTLNKVRDALLETIVSETITIGENPLFKVKRVIYNKLTRKFFLLSILDKYLGKPAGITIHGSSENPNDFFNISEESIIKDTEEGSNITRLDLIQPYYEDISFVRGSTPLDLIKLFSQRMNEAAYFQAGIIKDSVGIPDDKDTQPQTDN